MITHANDPLYPWQIKGSPFPCYGFVLWDMHYFVPSAGSNR